MHIFIIFETFCFLSSMSPNISSFTFWKFLCPWRCFNWNPSEKSVYPVVIRSVIHNKVKSILHSRVNIRRVRTSWKELNDINSGTSFYANQWNTGQLSMRCILYHLHCVWYRLHISRSRIAELFFQVLSEIDKGLILWKVEYEGLLQFFFSLRWEKLHILSDI